MIVGSSLNYDTVFTRNSSDGSEDLLCSSNPRKRNKGNSGMIVSRCLVDRRWRNQQSGEICQMTKDQGRHWMSAAEPRPPILETGCSCLVGAASSSRNGSTSAPTFRGNGKPASRPPALHRSGEREIFSYKGDRKRKDGREFSMGMVVHVSRVHLVR